MTLPPPIASILPAPYSTCLFFTICIANWAGQQFSAFCLSEDVNWMGVQLLARGVWQIIDMGFVWLQDITEYDCF